MLSNTQSDKKASEVFDTTMKVLESGKRMKADHESLILFAIQLFKITRNER